MNQKAPAGFSFAALWKEISMVAKFILFGLFVISGIVLTAFVSLILAPGPVKAGEDLYVHIALAILIPFATIGLLSLTFGYAYYQLCKQQKVQPFWEIWFK